MITFELTKDGANLKAVDFSLNEERTTLYNFFKKKSKDADFNALVDRGIWDGLDKFMTEDGLIKVGLWKEIENYTEMTNNPTNINKIIPPLLNLDLNKENYNKFVTTLYEGILTDKGEPFYPRDYQYEGAYRALKYGFCCEELATSSGKTSIFHTYMSYLKFIGKIDKDHKAILVVPNVTLVNQTAKAFEQYTNGLVKWNIHLIGGTKNSFDQEKFDECDLLITTYQSMLNLVPICLENKLENLIKKKITAKPQKGSEKVTKEDVKLAQEKRQKDIIKLKKKLQAAKISDMCSKFTVVCIDESHKARGDSIGDIIHSCTNWKYKLGLSGTLKIDPGYSDFFRMQERMGPLVMTLSAKFLQDKGYSPDVKIKRVYLEYDRKDPTVAEYVRIQEDKEVREKVKAQFTSAANFGKHMLDIERQIIFDSYERMEFISRLVKKLNKNTLILFSDVKNEYGLNISEKIKRWNHNTFYIDGGIDNADREVFKDVMEKEDNVVIVASYGTFATGIDLKNVHHIIFVESTKAEITIRQAVGRGMRYLIGKNEIVIWDIIDDLSGYSIRHSNKRMDIFKDQKFEILGNQKVDLKGFTLD